MQNHDTLPALKELDDWRLVNEDQDLRGRPLLTHSGDRLGTVRRMLVDTHRERVAAVVLDDGRQIPVEDIEIRGGNAYLDEGFSNRTPDIAPAATGATSTGTEERIPVAEEELVVGKREVERGHIHVRSHTVETPVHEQVRLRDEHIDIERRPVDAPVRDTAGIFQERSIEMHEVDEEAVVAKEARVVEEVVVRKEEGERVEEIDDTVRRTEVDIDRDIDDADDRQR